MTRSDLARLAERQKIFSTTISWFYPIKNPCIVGVGGADTQGEDDPQWPRQIGRATEDFQRHETTPADKGMRAILHTDFLNKIKTAKFILKRILLIKI